MTPDILQNRQFFTPVWELDHSNLIHALKPWIVRKTTLSLVYVLVNLAAVALVGWHAIASHVSWIDVLVFVCLGMTAGLLMLVPVHEYVHALVYRASGAKEVRIRYQWRTLSAYCVADKFVLRAPAFELVYLGPFLILNPPLALAALVTTGKLALFCSGALLIHIGACSGDVALVNWMRQNGDSRLWTYDDEAAGKSYFYAQNPIA